MRIISARNLSSATKFNIGDIEKLSKVDFKQKYNTNIATSPNLSNETSPRPFRIIPKNTIKTMY